MRSNRRSRNAVVAAAAVVLIAAAVLAARHWLASRPSPALLLRAAIDAIEAKDRDRAIRLLDDILRRDPANAKALLYRGEMARDAGDVTAALEFWARIGDDRPEEAATARFLEALVPLSRHQAREAEPLLLEAARLHPAFLAPHEKLAGLYQLQLRSAEPYRSLGYETRCAGQRARAVSVDCDECAGHSYLGIDAASGLSCRQACHCSLSASPAYAA